MIKKVLDHGFVRLVSYMRPVLHEMKNLQQLSRGTGESQFVRPAGWTGDLEVVRNARVSYNADWRTGQDEGSDLKLINSMTQRGHTSPFEAMVFTFEVKAPIFVFRQWHRHRTWSYNELSARYAPMEEEFYIPEPSLIGGQHETDKQMRSSHEVPQATAARDIIRASNANAFAAYKDLLNFGVARELARSVLPVSIYSRMFATVDLHNLKHFLLLRQDAHAQYEIRVYADAIHDLVAQVCPLSMAAFDTKRSGGA